MLSDLFDTVSDPLRALVETHGYDWGRVTAEALITVQEYGRTAPILSPRFITGPGLQGLHSALAEAFASVRRYLTTRGSLKVGSCGSRAGTSFYL